MFTLLFLAVVVLLLLVPLIPALTELLRRSDVSALTVDQQHDGKPTRFALNFRDFVQRRSTSAHDTTLTSDTSKELTAEQPIVEIDSDVQLDIDPGEAVLSQHSVTLSKGLWMHQEVYAKKDVTCEANVHVRAVLAEERFATRADVTVLRWAHATVAQIGNRNEMYGRLTADNKLVFENTAVFQRLNSPSIAFSSGKPIPIRQRRPPINAMNRVRPADLPGLIISTDKPRRSVVKGALNLPKNSLFKGDLIVRGKLKIGEGCLIIGSVKAAGSILLGGRTRIFGSVVSRESIFVGHDCKIKGLLVAERKAIIGNNVTVGSLEHPSTITAERIEISPGTTMSGTIWARRLGRARGDE